MFVCPSYVTKVLRMENYKLGLKYSFYKKKDSTSSVYSLFIFKEVLNHLNCMLKYILKIYYVCPSLLTFFVNTKKYSLQKKYFL